ncbi:MAG: hypothetical protein Q9214_005288 [Letrouitia sp. 1 TL-2023]
MSRKKLYENDPTWVWKFTLRILSTVLGVTVMAMLAYIMNDLVSKSYNVGFRLQFALVLLLAILFSLAWNIANIAVTLSTHRAIFPGANVACDLLLLIFVGGSSIWLGVGLGISDKAYYFYDFANLSVYEPTFYSYQFGVLLGADTVSFLIVLFHLALFISACRYTHQHRRQRSNAKKERRNEHQASKSGHGDVETPPVPHQAYETAQIDSHAMTRQQQPDSLQIQTSTRSSQISRKEMPDSSVPSYELVTKGQDTKQDVSPDTPAPTYYTYDQRAVHPAMRDSDGRVLSYAYNTGALPS